MRLWRPGAILLGCGGFLMAALRWMPSLPASRWDAWWSWLAADPQRAVTLLAGFAGWLIAGWLFLVAALALLSASARRSSRSARRAVDLLTPRFARGLVRVLLGAAVAVGAGGPAMASAVPSAAMSAGALPSLAPVPAPVVAAPELPPPIDLDRPGEVAVKPSRSEPDVPESHRVQPGDTLWDLAAERLPAGSSPASITRSWQRWYAANRQQIGADPGLLLVGEVLVIPQESR
jgi:nucleoid-associated protein YgaU